MALYLPLFAARNVVWKPTIQLRYLGGALPLAGASIAMQVRLYPGATGAALASLTGIPFSDAPDPDLAGGRVLTLNPTITEATLQGLPGLNQPEAGDAQTFAQDIVVTYADAVDERLAEGPFTVSPGVTV